MTENTILILKISWCVCILFNVIREQRDLYILGVDKVEEIALQTFPNRVVYYLALILLDVIFAPVGTIIILYVDLIDDK